MLIQLNQINKTIGGEILFENLNLSIQAQEKIGLIGGNGCGQETLLAQGLQLNKMETQQDQVGPEALAQLLVRYGKLQAEFETAGGYILTSQLEQIAQGLGINHLLEQKLSFLSGGEQTLLALAKLLLQEPDVFLLDEPTNHLDISTRELLEDVLALYQGTLLVVSHDRYFLEKVTTSYLEIQADEIFPVLQLS